MPSETIWPSPTSRKGFRYASISAIWMGKASLQCPVSSLCLLICSRPFRNLRHRALQKIAALSATSESDHARSDFNKLFGGLSSMNHVSKRVRNSHDSTWSSISLAKAPIVCTGSESNKHWLITIDCRRATSPIRALQSGTRDQ